MRTEEPEERAWEIQQFKGVQQRMCPGPMEKRCRNIKGKKIKPETHGRKKMRTFRGIRSWDNPQVKCSQSQVTHSVEHPLKST